MDLGISMLSPIVVVLPYLEIDHDAKLGNLRFTGLHRVPEYSPYIDKMFYTRLGKLIRNPTVIPIHCRHPQKTDSFFLELDSVIDCLAYVIFDDTLTGRGTLYTRKRKDETRIEQALGFERSAFVLKRDQTKKERFLEKFGRPYRSEMTTIDNFVYHVFYEFIDESCEEPHELSASEKDKQWNSPDIYRFRLRTKRLARNRLWQALSEFIECANPHPILSAIRWANLSRIKNQFLGSDHHLLCRCIALETLFELRGTDKRNAFAQSVNELIPNPFPKQLAIWAKRFYQRRSEIVHGESKDRSRSMSKPAGDEFFRDLALSDLLFNICLKTKLKISNIFDWEPSEIFILDRKVDSLLLSDKKRLEMLRRTKLDDLTSRGEEADHFLRILDAIDYSGTDDGEIRGTLCKLSELSIGIIEYILRTLKLTERQKNLLEDDKERIQALNFSEIPSHALPGPEEGFGSLPIPGVAEFSGFGVPVPEIIYQRRADRWLWRSRYRQIGMVVLLARIRKDEHLRLVPVPYISLDDLYCAMQSLHEYRRMMNPEE